jgi:hypothetical protein
LLLLEGGSGRPQRWRRHGDCSVCAAIASSSTRDGARRVRRAVSSRASEGGSALPLTQDCRDRRSALLLCSREWSVSGMADGVEPDKGLEVLVRRLLLVCRLAGTHWPTERPPSASLGWGVS